MCGVDRNCGVDNLALLGKKLLRGIRVKKAPAATKQRKHQRCRSNQRKHLRQLERQTKARKPNWQLTEHMNDGVPRFAYVGLFWRFFVVRGVHILLTSGVRTTVGGDRLHKTIMSACVQLNKASQEGLTTRGIRASTATIASLPGFFSSFCCLRLIGSISQVSFSHVRFAV